MKICISEIFIVVICYDIDLISSKYINVFGLKLKKKNCFELNEFMCYFKYYICLQIFLNVFDFNIYLEKFKDFFY